MKELTVGLVQLDCVLGDREANLERMAGFAATAGMQGADLVLFPELCTTGYLLGSRFREMADPIPGDTTDELGRIAREHRVYLVAGMLERHADRLYNACVLLSPDGDLVGRYRKAHLFAAEKELMERGDEPGLFDIEQGRVALTICYDMVFPEYIRRLVDGGAELILNSTDWITDDYQRGTWGWSGPKPRLLAQGRALENTVFFAMADRVGHEEGFTSLGYSCLCGPSGSVLAGLEEGEGVAVGRVSYEGVEKWRAIATYLADQRPDFYGRVASLARR